MPDKPVRETQWGLWLLVILSVVWGFLIFFLDGKRSPGFGR